MKSLIEKSGISIEASMLLKEEMDFYESYKWTLLPFLSFEQIMERLKCLINEDLNTKEEWHRREWNINLYMLSSAAADSADDYLVRGAIDLTKLSDYISLMRRPVKLLREISLSYSSIRGALRDQKLREWRKEWADRLLLICEPLAANLIPTPDDQLRLRNAIMPLLNSSFPVSLMSMRTRIPAAYRSQDLTHHDFISLAQKYVTKNINYNIPQLVIGLRTAGSYIAPIVCAYLKKAGFQQVSYLTIRPKGYIHPFNKKQLEQCLLPDTHFIIVDEPPNTGKAVARCIKILRRFGRKNERITVMVPTHPARRDWVDPSLKASFGDTDIVTLESEEWYKNKLLAAEEFCSSITPYLTQLGFKDIKVADTADTVHINNELAQNPEKAFHIRLKKVYQVVAKNNNGQQINLPIMAKSVGWGWLGYHAALAAQKLSGFIPRVYGLRDGFMYMDWIEYNKESKEVLKEQGSIASRLSSYISTRTNQLRLKENPMSFLSSYRDSGLQSISIVLSNAFGAKVSKLKRGWVRKQLEKIHCPVPTLLDSRMARDEWVNSENSLLKTDFEHHGFSKTASYNIVDPAYDIAKAMLEFEFSDDKKEEFITRYAQQTGDKSINDRLIYYKLLVGSEAMDDSLSKINNIEYSHMYKELNYKYVRSWNFLVSEVTHHVAKYCVGEQVKNWATPLFVMDIDDVMDKNIFGFPSTTANGIRAISLLREHGICSVINTARHLEEVKVYCKNFGFAGGISEYGSMIWDNIEQKADILISPTASDELEVLREALSKIPGVFINPFYRYSIRAYSFDRQRTIPVPDATIGELFGELGIKHLTAKRSYIDTAIVDSSVDKGKALLRLKELKGLNNGMIAAIGDSEADLPMLMVADYGFLVSNSSIELKRKAHDFGITTVSSSYQSGLLNVVRSFLHINDSKPCERCDTILKKLGQNSDLLWNILKIADMSSLQHWLHAFNSDVFEGFKE